MATATVRRNSRELREMWDNATRAISYTLANGFVGEDITVDGAHEWFDRVQSKSTWVHRTKHGYRIHYHSNHWTDLLCPPSR